MKLIFAFLLRAAVLGAGSLLFATTPAIADAPLSKIPFELDGHRAFITVHGDSDIVVPLDDNSGLLKKRYEAAGGSIAVKVIPGEGHKVSPAFFECRELVDFVIANAVK
jgi:predicted esterase